MTKEAAIRSIRRRVALTKAADDYSALINGYASMYRPGIVGAGTRVAANDNLRKSGYPPAKPPATPPAPPAARPAPRPPAPPAARPAPAGRVPVKAAQTQLDVAQMEQEARKRIAQETRGSAVGTTTRFSPQLQQLMGRLQQAKGRRITGYHSGSGFQYA